MTIPPNFRRGIGKLSTDRYDFQDHLEGVNPEGFTDFRHKADQIDMNPSVIGGATTVQGSLNNIESYIISQTSAGQGFIAVGDGYDTWHAADGNQNFDSSIPSLDTLLNPIFNAIITNSALPSNFSRIKRGGVVLIKSGTYIIKNTINVPPGITLIGEGYGTKLVNATSLDLTTNPPTPKIVRTPLSLFSIVADANRSVNDGAALSNDGYYFMFSRETKIMNLVICDNFVENTLLGDVFYKLPQNYTSTLSLNPPALISQQGGSNLTLENVFGVGRVTFSAGNVSQVTGSLVQLDSTPAANGTILNVKNCFIDGFSIPIIFKSSAGSQDYLNIDNNKIRAYGYYNGISSVTTFTSNSFVNANICNISFNENYLVGGKNNFGAGLFMENGASITAPNLQNKSRVVVSANNTSIFKSSNISNSDFKYFFTSGITASDFMSVLVYGNNYQDDYRIAVDSSDLVSGFTFNSSGITVNANLFPGNIQELHYSKQVTITNDYTPGNFVGTADFVIICNPSALSININLPAIGSSYRLYIIRDISGTLETYPINLIPTSPDKIEGFAGTRSLYTNNGKWQLLQTANGWIFI